jgi:hypothetical protein
MALVGVVLMPSLYLTSAKCVLFALGRERLSGWQKDAGLLYVRPLCEYADSDWPCSEWCFKWVIWSPDTDGE